MNWEHTDIAMAPKAGRVDELRAEAATYRLSRGLIREKRSRRVRALRSRMAAIVSALADLIGPSKKPRVTNADAGGIGSRASN